MHPMGGLASLLSSFSSIENLVSSLFHSLFLSVLCHVCNGRRNGASLWDSSFRREKTFLFHETCLLEFLLDVGIHRDILLDPVMMNVVVEALNVSFKHITRSMFTTA